MAEPLEVNGICSSEREKEERVITAISEAGLRPATETAGEDPKKAAIQAALERVKAKKTAESGAAADGAATAAPETGEET